jgi:SAM-dependent methyltransferase
MYKKYSFSGDEGLKNIEQGTRFVNWLYSMLKPYISGDILEVGSGIGTYSQRIVQDFPNHRIILSDIDPEYITQLQEKFKTYPNVLCTKLNIERAEDYLSIQTTVDTVIASNVLEHISDDVMALTNIYSHLNPKGKFILLVPAHNFLYNSIDRAIGHYRRYSKNKIKQVVAQTPFNIKNIFNFNVLAIPGWFFQGHILHKTVVNESKMKLFNTLVPILNGN